MIKIIEKIQSIILSTFYFIFPLFFLTYTSDPFGISKFYLLAFTGLLLLSLTTLSILTTRKLIWKKSPFDAPMLLFILTLLISLVFVSPNKISAALNVNYGVVSIFFLSLIFLYTSTLKNKKSILSSLNLSAIIIAILSIISLFQPFKNVGLPQQLDFLKSPYFTPIGARFDLILLSLFMSVYWGTKIFLKLKVGKIEVNKLWYLFIFFILYLVAAGAAIFSIVKPLIPNLTFYLPSYKHSWFAAVETLKSILSSLFGVGVDNFSNIFARIKDLSFNQSDLWNNTISYSRSTILHIFTTTGLFGLLGFLSIVFSSLGSLGKLDKEKKNSILPMFVFMFLAMLLVTPSLFLFFLFFVTIAVINSEILKNEDSKTSIDLKDLIPLHFGIILVLVLFIGTSSYLLGRTYAASVYSNNAILNLNKGNLSSSYRDQRNAINLNPYNENYRTFFSQTNLLYADTIIKNAKKDENNQVQLAEDEKLQVSQAIQQSISEAKNSVALNSLSPKNWAGLGDIYSNLINATQGSDSWAISSYQRAINLDPNNPAYRVKLGSVYYLLGKYPDSTILFRQAVTLKPDWANARYNLGWSLYQQKDYQSAATEMKTVLTLLDKNKNPQDYKNAKETFDNFKKQVDLTQLEQQKASQGENLNLPQQSSPQISPKIDLPQTASPEAK
ncbi:MAG: tetratricopeptide repeat protein [bacterium]